MLVDERAPSSLFGKRVVHCSVYYISYYVGGSVDEFIATKAGTHADVCIERSDVGIPFVPGTCYVYELEVAWEEEGRLFLKRPGMTILHETSTYVQCSAMQMLFISYAIMDAAQQIDVDIIMWPQQSPTVTLHFPIRSGHSENSGSGGCPKNLPATPRS